MKPPVPSRWKAATVPGTEQPVVYTCEFAGCLLVSRSVGKEM